MSALTFYFKVLQALEEIEAPYMIVGAFAGLAFGVNRATFDIDIPSTDSGCRLVDLSESDFDALAARFPLPRCVGRRALRQAPGRYSRHAGVCSQRPRH
jgi:hypothetical protein